MLKLIKGTKKYNARVYGIKDIDLVLPIKGLVLISGESGSGKTTLLNILTASDSITSGELYYRNSRINEKNMEDYRSQHVAIVYQDFELINDLSVYDNVALGANVIGEMSEKRILSILDSLKISNLKDSLISECSGGEVQRVAIARALTKNTQMIFADEPTGNLDSKNSDNILQLLKDISEDKLVVLISHDTNRASKYCDYYIELSDGEIIKNDCPGTIEQADKITVEINKNNSAIPNRLNRKLARWNISRNNLKPIFNISIIALIMSLLYLIMPLGFYDYPLVLSRNLRRADLPLVMLNTGEHFNIQSLSDIAERWELNVNPVAQGSFINDLLQHYTDNGVYHNNGVYVEASQYIAQYDESYGLEFVFGNAPMDDYEVGISLTQAYDIVSMQYIYNEHKEIVRVNSIDDLIGKYFFINDGGIYDIAIVITGVFEDYYVYRDQQINGTVEDFNSPKYQIAKDNFLVGLAVTNYYTMSVTSGRKIPFQINNVENDVYLLPLTNSNVLSSNGAQISQNLADNIGIELGDTITLMRLTDEKEKAFVVEKIVEDGYNRIYINSNTYVDEFNSNRIYKHIVNIGNRNQLKKLRLINKELEETNEKVDHGFFNEFMPRMTSINAYDLGYIVRYLTELSIVLFIPISIGLIILLFLNTNALTNYSISTSMKDFSILRSIGYSKRNIRKIIVLKSLLVAIPQMLIGLIIGLILVILFNLIMSTQTIAHITIISLDMKKFLTINIVACISYAMIVMIKSGSLFRDSAVKNYKKNN